MLLFLIYVKVMEGHCCYCNVFNPVGNDRSLVLVTGSSVKDQDASFSILVS